MLERVSRMCTGVPATTTLFVASQRSTCTSTPASQFSWMKRHRSAGGVQSYLKPSPPCCTYAVSAIDGFDSVMRYVSPECPPDHWMSGGSTLFGITEPSSGYAIVAASPLPDVVPNALP